MKSILSRSMSRCALRTATEASVSVSSQRCSIGRPRTPPRAFCSSIARIMPRRSAWPLSAKVPVASQVSPMTTGFFAWAPARRQFPMKPTPAPNAAAPFRTCRRLGRPPCSAIAPSWCP